MNEKPFDLAIAFITAAGTQLIWKEIAVAIAVGAAGTFAGWVVREACNYLKRKYLTRKIEDHESPKS